MAAIIQSDIERTSVLIGPILQGESRDDLRPGDVVKLSSVDTHTTYAWTLAYAPKARDGTDSSAVLLTPDSDTTEFTVDNEGPYLVRLVVDAGLSTEDVQFIRLRALTLFGDLRLVAAGERRDEVAIIPADIDPEGWANDQNDNLLELLAFIERVSVSGRILYVDANRGTNNLNPADDPTIAEEYGDYSSIDTAIAAAAGAATLPSATNPYLILVQPGFYEEDIEFLPHIHVVAAGHSTGDGANVRVRALNNGGAAHTAALTSAGDYTLIRGLVFENNAADQSHPMLDKSGLGTLLLNEVTILQNGSGATTGPTVGMSAGTLVARKCNFKVTSSEEQIVCFEQEGSSSTSWLYECDLEGPNGAEINTGYASGVSTTFVRSRVEATRADIAAVFGIKSSADDLKLLWSEVALTGGTTTDAALTMHPGGGIKGSPVATEVKYSIIDGVIYFNNDNVAANNTTLLVGASEYDGISLTGASPALGTQAATTRGDSILYDDTTVTAPWADVQDALEQIAGVLDRSGASGGGISLDASYDGLDFSTMTTGSGTGRDIYADAGPVRILSDPSPTTPPDLASTDGRLQVEGPVEVGGIDAPELALEPNPYGAGPTLRMGQTVFPNTSTHRAIAAAVVSARATGSPNHYNYNLRLQSESADGASQGETGRVIVQGGDALGSTHDAADVYVQAGLSTGSGAEGGIYLAPGAKTTATTAEGKIWIARGLSNTAATLLATNAFTGGVSGDITFAIAGAGLQTASILDTDTIGNVATKLSNLKGVASAVDSGGKLLLTTEMVGPNADIYFAFDDQSGALNTALGDFGATATFTAGTFGDTVSVECDGASSLTVGGDLTVTGTVTGTIPTTYDRTVINGDTDLGTTEQYVGVDNTSAAAMTVSLPDTVAGGAVEGREIIIKDEAGNASTYPITVQVGNPQTGLVDSDTSLVLNSDHQSVTVVCNGLDSPSTIWFVV